MEEATKTPVAGVVVTVLVLIIGAYLLSPDDDPLVEPDRTPDTTDTSDTSDTTIYPGDPSLPDP